MKEFKSGRIISDIIEVGSFPKSRPNCCGRKMFAGGGDCGKTTMIGSIRYWKCETCGQECKDIAS